MTKQTCSVSKSSIALLLFTEICYFQYTVPSSNISHEKYCCLTHIISLLELSLPTNGIILNLRQHKFQYSDFLLPLILLYCFSRVQHIFQEIFIEMDGLHNKTKRQLLC